MAKWTEYSICNAMTAGLAVIGLVGALTIDNQLAVIKNDCFERLAIGNKLNDKDVYANLELKTVPDCQRECTKDGDKCRSFSFGIGVKGNGSCELSTKVVKETADLKPIGTVQDPEFDLYIKKLGCKLVIEQNPTTELGHVQPVTQDDSYASSSNNYRPSHSDVQHVHTTLISVRPDPKRPTFTGLGPAIGYYDPNRNDKIGYVFDGKPVRPYNPDGYEGTRRYDHFGDRYGRPRPVYYDDPRPPFRPSSLNHPYNDEPYFRPGTGGYDPGPSNDIDGSSSPNGKPRPEYIVDRIDFDVNSIPPRRPNRPGGYGGVGQIDYDRPFVSRPGYDRNDGYDVRPKPQIVDNAGSGYDNSYQNRPIDNGYRPDSDRPKPRPPPRPMDDGYNNRPDPDRPPLNRPRPIDDGYDNRPKPRPPPRPMDDAYNNRPDPDRPPFNRPGPIDDGYDNRPNPRPPIDRPRPMDDGYQERPNPRPPLDRPRPMDDGYQNRPDSDRPPFDRPRPMDDSYQNRPDSDRPPFDRPRPTDDGYQERPNPRPPLDRPRPMDDDYQNRPDSDRPPFDRPRPMDDGYQERPNPRPPLDRPRPMNDGYQHRPDSGRPPFDRPRPIDDGYQQRPNSPRPIDGGYQNRPDFDRPNPHPPLDRPKPLTDTYQSGPKPFINRPNPRPPLDRPIPINEGYGNTPDGYDRPQIDRPSYDDDYFDRPRPPFIPNNGYDNNNPNTGYSNNIKPLTDSYNGNRRGDNLPEDGKNSSKRNNGSNANQIQNSPRPEHPHMKPKPIITHSVGPHGEMITAIITEIEPACYRRALAGKRVTRSLVRRALPCERIEDCQQECADEKRFVCEGFNYRLDPTGRGNGDCELLDLPMVRLDMIRDIYTDPDYDVYEKDRNASPSCRGYRPPGMSLYGGDRFRDRDYDRYDSDRFDRGSYYDRNRRPSTYYDERRVADRRGDGYYYSDRNEYSYLPKPLNQVPYLPKRPYDGYRDKNYYDRNNWGSNDWGSYGGTYGNFGKPDYNYGSVKRIDINRHHYYQPSRVGGTSDWGRYGGSYGNGGNSYDKGIPAPYDIPAGDTYAPVPPKGIYLPKYDRPTYSTYTPNDDYGSHKYVPTPPKPTYDDVGYDYPKPSQGLTPGSYGNVKPTFDSSTGYNYPKPTVPTIPPSSLDPLEHKKFIPHGGDDHVGYNFLKDECSLRTATGFKLHKLAVKKYLSVPNIYDCEVLCFKEKDFECLSYSYRYTVSTNLPTDNCYLSGKSFKELDYYTDLEPDRDFDIYTMNNRKKCLQPLLKEHEYSECFWHTRSGQSFDPKIIRDAVNVKSIVECQLECIKATKFLCRGFSFRYGSPVIGGPAENCQLIDWPFTELDRRTHFVPEPGFEIYERGSFGHGCEPNHFSIRGKDRPVIGSKTDQLCYVGYGSPARLLPQAIRKSIFANTELDCKAECSKTRHDVRFQCMSFSYRNDVHRGDTNCDLSDILQRDLLTDIDYVNDPNSWLFAWDNFNPECTSIIDPSLISDHFDHDHESRDGSFDISRYGGYNPITAMDTWRVYSVSGWPCRRGSRCRQNKIGGFWYCELEGGNSDTWDYCCRPDHQCGYSAGYSYQWCYVGPARSQWRKCSEQYFPYIFNLIDRNDYIPFKPRPYIPSSKPSYGEAPPFIVGKPASDSFTPTSNRPHRPHFRPNRPGGHRAPDRRPSLNEYEQQFNIHFLDPPKPGGFGQPRYWPVSYLHNESPPETNLTEPRSEDMKMSKEMEEENRYAAIQNLIEIIKSNEINNIQYEIENRTSKMDDILLVKIPLPTNFSDDVKATDDNLSNPIDLTTTTTAPERSTIVIKDIGNRVSKSVDNYNSGSSHSVRQTAVYRKGFVTRTNVTRHGRFI